MVLKNFKNQILNKCIIKEKMGINHTVYYIMLGHMSI